MFDKKYVQSIFIYVASSWRGIKNFVGGAERWEKKKNFQDWGKRGRGQKCLD